MAEVVPFRAPFRLPGPEDRLTVVGRTGSGKTHLAAWVLSLADWNRRPWVIVDYKRDKLLRELPADELALKDRIPRHAGLYIVRPPPETDDEVEALLWRVWNRGRCGLYIDEGHMCPDRGGLKAIQSQGRSKEIQTIVLTQRPKWVSRFVFSEAEAISAFHLNDRRDRATVREISPIDLDQRLEPYHSYYYRVGDNQLFKMNPVPPRDHILNTFSDRNPARTKARML